MPAKADRNVRPTEREKKTQKETLDAEGLPVHGIWLVRFTLFPPQDNVIVANG